MNTKKTTTFENGLIWFGAAASLAEIMTGTTLAPLGLQKGLVAILLGHLIGCMLLFIAGVIGGKTEKSSMETVKISFGQKGGIIFAILNVIQLVGWTAIMIYDGAISANGIYSLGNWFWAVIIGVLIIVWIAVGIQNLGKLNMVAMSALSILTLILSFSIFGNGKTTSSITSSLTFGAAIELSIAMPLSWLPLINDYTHTAQKPVKASFISAVAYFVMSSWMYIIGMGAAIFANSSDIVEIILKAGLGVAGLLIIVLSTVATTFLDAFSAGVSCETISRKLNGKTVGIIVTIIGVIGAVLFPITNITNFLYFIGSVFAPMIAIQITDYFILKSDSSNINFKWSNIIVWLLGFIIYRLLMNVDIVVGNTIPSMIITMLISITVHKAFAMIRSKHIGRMI